MKNCDVVQKSLALTDVNKKSILLFGIPLC